MASFWITFLFEASNCPPTSFLPPRPPLRDGYGLSIRTNWYSNAQRDTVVNCRMARRFLRWSPWFQGQLLPPSLCALPHLYNRPLQPIAPAGLTDWLTNTWWRQNDTRCSSTEALIEEGSSLIAPHHLPRGWPALAAAVLYVWPALSRVSVTGRMQS